MYKGHIVTAVILAAGCGKRMNAGKNKLLLEVSGKSILSYTAKCFDLSEYVDELVFVAAEGECDAVKGLVSPYVSKPFSVVTGGKERSDSSYNGILASKDGIVMIHDGARAFCEERIIKETVEGAYKYGAAAPGIAVTDTVKRVENGFIKGTVSRDSLTRIQTPQVFMREEILAAHEKARKDGISVTDDCMLMENCGKDIFLVEGSPNNIKITTKEDLLTAEILAKEMNL
ncbi:MAG: 2-C-methyl-D-erythritol 4-phosphate cytidylyltransferase [Clostridia bacterium]|nr:2-C-methyl-D-erythritol 4-phosphate cytidylyltransferase [Clostridia bacterium]